MDYTQAFQGLTEKMVGRMEALPEYLDDKTLFEEQHSYLLCRVKRLLRFINANKEINAETEIEHLSEKIVDKAIQIMRTDYGGLILIERDGQERALIAAKGMSVDQADLLLTEGLLNAIFKEGNSLRIADLDTRLPVEEGMQAWGAFLAVPIIDRETTIGALFIGNRPEKNIFSEEDECLFMVFASQAAIAIEKALLYTKAGELTLIRERQRMAEILHDTVVQNLFTIGLNARKCLEDPFLEPQTEQRLSSIQRLSARSNCELRSAIYALKSPFLGRHDTLIDLLSDQVKGFQAQTGIACTLILPDNYLLPTAAIAEAIYRIVCESLNNIAKHAHARTALVSLNCEDDRLTITVQDDGVGLNKPISLEYDPQGLHFGIVMMKQAVEKLGGDFAIMNTDDQGLMVRAHFQAFEGMAQ